MTAESHPSIVSRLHGGLGNQLFAYATGYALARRTKASHKVDTRVFSEAGERPFALSDFDLPLDEATPGELHAVAPQWGPWWKNKLILWRQRRTPFARRRWVREETLDFDPRLADVRPPAYLDGWWQSEKYFAAHADEIRGMFRPRASAVARVGTLAARLAASDAIAVHVRRGDYVDQAHIAAFHGLCSADYYAQAIAWIRERRPNAPLVLFSDDPAWTRAQFGSWANARMIVGEPQHSAIEDFALLASCRHFVIANSSFSWWAAWLGGSPEKLVVAPRRWFRGRDVKPADRFPPGWHVIDA
jgi:hypothetical protein